MAMAGVGIFRISIVIIQIVTRKLPASTPSASARSQVQLCSPPVSPLCIVPDCVVSSESDPLRDGAVLLGFLRQLLLNLECLLGRHGDCCPAAGRH